jgi:hypothetical protein
MRDLESSREPAKLHGRKRLDMTMSGVMVGGSDWFSALWVWTDLKQAQGCQIAWSGTCAHHVDGTLLWVDQALLRGWRLEAGAGVRGGVPAAVTDVACCALLPSSSACGDDDGCLLPARSCPEGHAGVHDGCASDRGSGPGRCSPGTSCTSWSQAGHATSGRHVLPQR